MYVFVSPSLAELVPLRVTVGATLVTLTLCVAVAPVARRSRWPRPRGRPSPALPEVLNAVLVFIGVTFPLRVLPASLSATDCIARLPLGLLWSLPAEKVTVGATLVTLTLCVAVAPVAPSDSVAAAERTAVAGPSGKVHWKEPAVLVLVSELGTFVPWAGRSCVATAVDRVLARVEIE